MRRSYSEKDKKRRLANKAKDLESRIPETKRCPLCEVVKPASDFGINRTANSGLQSICKTCGHKKMRLRDEKKTAENKKLYPEGVLVPGIKRCRRCLTTKPSTQFNKNYQHNDCLNPYCKTCSGLFSKESRQRKKQRQAQAA